MIFAGAPVPEVITLVVIMVIGDLMPGVLVTPRQDRGRGAWLRTGPLRLPSAGSHLSHFRQLLLRPLA